MARRVRSLRTRSGYNRNRLDVHKTCTRSRRCREIYKNAVQRNAAAVLAEMSRIGIRAKNKLRSWDRTLTKVWASYLPPNIRKRAKTTQVRASVHDFLKKSPHWAMNVGSQNISPIDQLCSRATSKQPWALESLDKRWWWWITERQENGGGNSSW